jgi:hypothetical protein
MWNRKGKKRTGMCVIGGRWVIFLTQKQVKAGERCFQVCIMQRLLLAVALVAANPFGWVLAKEKAGKSQTKSTLNDLSGCKANCITWKHERDA